MRKLLLAMAGALALTLLWLCQAPPASWYQRAERQGCLHCHTSEGLGPYHKSLQCTTCHRGDPQQTRKDLAHQGLLPQPGELSLAMATCGQCHAETAAKVFSSLMASGRGIVAVNRFIFGEISSPEESHDSLSTVGTSPADTHLRALCVPCHLAYSRPPKQNWHGGGGCSACHAHYSSSAPKAHPAISLPRSNRSCLFCHSRSSRISLSYAGWHEVLSPPTQGRRRRLPDGRWLSYQGADVHHKRGLLCIDCHTVGEVMGDGNTYLRQQEALEISCQTCHTAERPKTLSYRQLSAQEKRLLRLWNLPKRQSWLTSQKGRALINVFWEKGQVVLVQKTSGRRFLVSPPSPQCYQIQGHRRLDCQACHTQWAPQCIRCHTEFQREKRDWDFLARRWRQGRWVEKRSLFLAGPPPLGVVKDKVRPVVPGMIFTLDKGKGTLQFFRLFTPIVAHTVGKSRSCQSCHLSSVALGWGRGELQYREGKWHFQPHYPPHPQDGLPWDSWIAPWGKAQGLASSRKDCRPLSPKEQQRVLEVGRCLSCHPFSPQTFQKIYRDFDRAKGYVHK